MERHEGRHGVRIAITLALIIAGAGAALVSGVDVMARVLDGLGHGTWPRLLIGTAESPRDAPSL